MEWKGIPYSLDAKEIVESVNSITTVAVDKIPTVVVSTSFSWEAVISAFFAALIPSFIAWYALNKNFKLAKYQNSLSSYNEISQELRKTIADYIGNTKMYISLIIYVQKIDPLTEQSKFEKYADEQDVMAVSSEISLSKLLIMLDNENKAQFRFSKRLNNISARITKLRNKKYDSNFIYKTVIALNKLNSEGFKLIRSLDPHRKKSI